jgi:hypothetical protein
MEAQQDVKPDLREIFNAIQILGKSGIAELRTYDSNGRPGFSGYFDDASKLAQAIYELSEKQSEGNAVGYTLQSLNPSIQARVNNTFASAQKGNSVSNDDVAEYSHLFIDCDPARPTGVSSTDGEKQAARQVADRMREFFSLRAIPSSLGDSGNGSHVIPPLKIPNTSDAPQLIQRVLQALKALFSTPQVKIDLTTYNPARIIKAYGTVARKGPNTPERPWRLSRIIDPGPADIHTHALDRAGLKKLLDELNQMLPPEMQATLALNSNSEFEVAAAEDVEATRKHVCQYMERAGIEYSKNVEHLDSGRGFFKAHYIHCPAPHGFTPTGTFVGSNESAGSNLRLLP